MLNNESLFDQPIDYGTQSMAIFPGWGNLPLRWIMRRNPCGITTDDLSSVDVRIFQGISLFIPISFNKAMRKGIGALQVIAAITREKTSHLTKHHPDIGNKVDRVWLPDQVKRCFLKTGEIAHISLFRRDDKTVVISNLKVSLELLF